MYDSTDVYMANSNTQLMSRLVALLTLCPLKTHSDAEIRKKKKRRKVEQFSRLLSSQ